MISAKDKKIELLQIQLENWRERYHLLLSKYSGALSNVNRIQRQVYEARLLLDRSNFYKGFSANSIQKDLNDYYELFKNLKQILK